MVGYSKTFPEGPTAMITGELKSKVDSIWDTMWSGGVSNPLSVIEQLTYLLFIKRLPPLECCVPPRRDFLLPK